MILSGVIGGLIAFGMTVCLLDRCCLPSLRASLLRPGTRSAAAGHRPDVIFERTRRAGREEYAVKGLPGGVDAYPAYILPGNT
ncbi:hypothetical protein KIF59_00635 [Enterobacter cloacae subsp. cloacae]|nr:hypothetical protein [Enterobacter cloacae subsp. cloacae]